MEIKQSILTENPCYKAGKKITVRGLMLHSVGCPQPSAEVFVKKWNHAESGRACVHAFIDGKTGVVYQTLPWEYRGWHGGGSSNNTHIGVEMCEPSCISYTGGASFICSDRAAAMAVVKRTYDSAVELFVILCRQFKLDPLGDGVIVSHKEGHSRGIASGHSDPEHLWNGLGTSYTMDRFRKEVAEKMGKLPDGMMPSPPPKSAAAAAGQKKGFAVGDRVKFLPGAAYYGGKPVPDWVMKDTWIIKSVNGDRAVVDWNVNGTSSINSPVNVAHLVHAEQPSGKDAMNVPPPPEGAPKPGSMPPPPGGAPTSGNMKISQRGVELVAKYEGCRLEAYKCPAGVWTIGYGHTAGVKPGDRLPSQEAAKNLLQEDLAKYAGHVNSCVKKGQITFPLTQNQFDALTSFCYNCGAGSLQKLVSGRSAAEIAEKLPAYNKGGGKVLAGLTKRREEEKALFLS